MDETDAWLTDPERARRLREAAFIIPLTFGRARIVVDSLIEPSFFMEDEFW
jgi:hypothetical protein